MTLHVMALDTGGTKSFALIADLHKRVIAEAHFDGLGAAHDDTCAALQPLEGAMEKVLREAALRAEEIGCVVVNLGGKNEQQMRSALHRIFPAAHVEVYRESSGVLAEQIGRAYGADAVLLAGTGTIAIAYSLSLIHISCATSPPATSTRSSRPFRWPRARACWAGRWTT